MLALVLEGAIAFARFEGRSEGISIVPEESGLRGQIGTVLVRHDCVDEALAQRTIVKLMRF